MDSSANETCEMRPSRSPAFPAILWIGLFAGTLDITENLVFNYLRGVTPKMVFQYIASGLISSRAFEIGAASVLLGVLIHYLIALTWTAIFYLASRKLSILVRRPVICGLLFGAFIYVFMNFAVLPLTALPHAPNAMTLASRINGILALLLCMGLTVSLLIHRISARADFA